MRLVSWAERRLAAGLSRWDGGGGGQFPLGFQAQLPAGGVDVATLEQGLVRAAQVAGAVINQSNHLLNWASAD